MFMIEILILLTAPLTKRRKLTSQMTLGVNTEGEAGGGLNKGSR